MFLLETPEWRDETTSLLTHSRVFWDINEWTKLEIWEPISQPYFVLLTSNDFRGDRMTYPLYNKNKK